MRRLTGIVLTIVLIFSTISFPVFAAEGPIIQLTLSKNKAVVGDSLQLQVVLKDFTDTNGDVVGVDVVITFDPKLVQVNSISEGDVIDPKHIDSKKFMNTFDNTTGKIHYAIATLGSKTFDGTGTLLDIHLIAKAKGSVPFTITSSTVIQANKPGVSLDHQTMNTSLSISSRPSPGGGDPGSGGPGNEGPPPTNDGGSSEGEDPNQGDSSTDNNNDSDTTNTEEQNDIKVLEKFNDKEEIENLNWAAPAVAYLTRLEVLKGDNNQNFRPNDNITREEIAQAMANLLNLQFANGFTNTHMQSPSSMTFPDMDQSMWSFQAVQMVTNAGLMQGKHIDGNVFFDPKGEITRAELITVIVRLLNPGDVDTSNVPFTDIEGNFAEQSIKIAYALGIVNGRTTTTFAPNEKATRAEVAVMLYKAIMYLTKTPSKDDIQ